MKTKSLIIMILIIGTFQINVLAKKNKTVVYDTITSNINKTGTALTFVFEKGKSHNHPSFAIWIENLEGEFLQNLYVTQFVAKGVFGHAPVNDSMWGAEPGEAYRPAALPYWNHKRIEQPKLEKIMPSESNPIPDAYSGATPPNNFILQTDTDNKIKGKYRIMMEINQTWDWNEYWTNNKYPNDKQYKTSCQPSLVYFVEIDTEDGTGEFWMNPIGHGHYSGQDGKLYTDLSTLTTALEIVKSIKVIVK